MLIHLSNTLIFNMQSNNYTKKGILTRIILFLVWFAFLVFLVDGLGYFPLLVEKFGYAVVEIILLIVVVIPAIPILLYVRRYKQRNRL